MQQIEKEIKVLNINKEMVIAKLNESNAIFKESATQRIYVFDLIEVCERFDEAKDLFLNSTLKSKCVAKDKLMSILLEIDDLLNAEDEKKIFEITNLHFLSEIMTENDDTIRDFLHNDIINEIIHSYKINPNKWIRLRQTNDITTLTVKHIIKKVELKDKFQNVKETEIVVSSLEDANLLLNEIGCIYRNYQEKERIVYMLNELEIDIDSWPLIPSYLEIECDDVKKLEDVLELLDLRNHEIVSCNTEQVYKNYGIDIYNYRELKF